MLKRDPEKAACTRHRASAITSAEVDDPTGWRAGAVTESSYLCPGSEVDTTTTVEWKLRGADTGDRTSAMGPDVSTESSRALLRETFGDVIDDAQPTRLSGESRTSGAMECRDHDGGLPRGGGLLYAGSAGRKSSFRRRDASSTWTRRETSPGRRAAKARHGALPYNGLANYCRRQEAGLNGLDS